MNFIDLHQEKKYTTKIEEALTAQNVCMPSPTFALKMSIKGKRNKDKKRPKKSHVSSCYSIISSSASAVMYSQRILFYPRDGLSHMYIRLILPTI